MWKQINNKKAVSLIISYVLLISIGLAIAGIVFGWLRFYANIEEAEKCPEGISLIIMQESYFQEYVADNTTQLNLTIQNRGRFNIDGFVVRGNNRTGSNIGVGVLLNTLSPLTDISSLTDGENYLAPNKIIELKLNSTHLSSLGNKICFVDVQPFIKDENGNPIYCAQSSSRQIPCMN